MRKAKNTFNTSLKRKGAWEARQIVPILIVVLVVLAAFGYWSRERRTVEMDTVSAAPGITEPSEVPETPQEPEAAIVAETPSAPADSVSLIPDSASIFSEDATEQPTSIAAGMEVPTPLPSETAAITETSDAAAATGLTASSDEAPLSSRANVPGTPIDEVIITPEESDTRTENAPPLSPDTATIPLTLDESPARATDATAETSPYVETTAIPSETLAETATPSFTTDTTQQEGVGDDSTMTSSDSSPLTERAADSSFSQDQPNDIIFVEEGIVRTTGAAISSNDMEITGEEIYQTSGDLSAAPVVLPMGTAEYSQEGRSDVASILEDERGEPILHPTSVLPPGGSGLSERYTFPSFSGTNEMRRTADYYAANEENRCSGSITVYPNANDLRIRTGPSMNYETVSSVYQGSRYPVILWADDENHQTGSNGDRWFFITDKNNRTLRGWISSSQCDSVNVQYD